MTHQDGNMKTITLQVEDVDQVVIDELKDSYQLKNKSGVKSGIKSGIKSGVKSGIKSRIK